LTRISFFPQLASGESHFNASSGRGLANFKPSLAPELVEELAEKLELRLHFSAEQVVETLADYLGFLRVVQISKVLNAVPRDPEDNMVLECAIEGQAQYVVSGDNDLLVLREFRDIQIVRASDFLKVLAGAKG
jgi:putative PIN family toxin of toxin-antitoxin system